MIQIILTSFLFAVNMGLILWCVYRLGYHSGHMDALEYAKRAMDRIFKEVADKTNNPQA